MLLRTDTDLVAEIVLEPVGIVVAVVAVDFGAALAAVGHIAAVPFVRIDCRLRLNEKDRENCDHSANGT